MTGTSWALALATYRRPEMLRRCLRLAARQTRAPAEIVVVDGSDDWERSRERALDEVGPEAPAVRWRYVAAKRRSSAAQRNQAVRLATSDVVFVIDDDSLLYPDCAEKILEVYDADVRRRVAGVSAQAVDRPPPEDAGPGAAATAARPVYTATEGGRLRRAVRRWFRAEERFVPYEPAFPALPMPEEIWHLHVTRPLLFPGFSMTWRREIALAEPFEERMRRYAAGEDSDMSYRASRRGALVKALDARLHHVGASGGRLPPYVTTALGALNALLLHRLHGSDREYSRRANRALLRRRLAIELLKDLRAGDPRLPRARGIWFGLRRVDALLDARLEELDGLYDALQSRLIDAVEPASEAAEPSGPAGSSGNGMPNQGRASESPTTQR